MASQKKFSTFSEQVEWLQSEKKLVIDDKKRAEDILQRIGYFSLIGGYKYLFRVPLTKKYKENTSFEEIYSLYLFDGELRELFFKYLLQIERHLRSLISYYFSELYGESQSAYLNIDNLPFGSKKAYSTSSMFLISFCLRLSNKSSRLYLCLTIS